MFTSKSLGDEI